MTLVTSSDVATLNAARLILWNFSQDAMGEQDAATARARAFADVAENHLFTFLSVLNVYCDVPLTHAQLHDDAKPFRVAV